MLSLPTTRVRRAYVNVESSDNSYTDMYIYIYIYIYTCICKCWVFRKLTYAHLPTTHTATANPTWGDIFESSKLKAQTSLLPRFSEKRLSSFELWALKQHSKMSPQVGLAIHFESSHKLYMYMLICRKTSASTPPIVYTHTHTHIYIW